MASGHQNDLSWSSKFRRGWGVQAPSVLILHPGPTTRPCSGNLKEEFGGPGSQIPDFLPGL